MFSLLGLTLRAQPVDSDGGVIRVHARDPIELLNPIDPSPVAERDLNAEVERFIVSWARDLPRHAPLELRIQVDRPAPGGCEEVTEAVHRFFAQRSATIRRELRTLLRRGRISLIIGLIFLAVCVVAADVAGHALNPPELAEVVQQGLNVAGWVAMWRPMEIFLYAWWPLASDARLYDRLSQMPVTMTGAEQGINTRKERTS
jgi:hypothetical protein